MSGDFFSIHSVHIQTFLLGGLLHLLLLLLLEYLSPEVSLGTSVASLPGWNSVPTVTPGWLGGGVEILRRVHRCRLPLCCSIEIIKHQVHVRRLFWLQMMLDIFIIMNFYLYSFDIISILGYGPRLMEICFFL
jgi:hypothetical protein